MTRRVLPASLLAIAVVAVSLSACASQSGPADMPTASPSSPIPVAGEGTVIQVDGGPVEFCLGPVLTSYPPQCTGPELVGWDWDSVDGAESASGTTWGTYAVTGLWDGSQLTVSTAIQLALFDPMPMPDPALDPAHAGTTPSAELDAIQSQVSADFPVEVLAVWVENGYVFVRVIADDGSVQAWADERYGPDVVQVRPALRS